VHSTSSWRTQQDSSKFGGIKAISDKNRQAWETPMKLKQRTAQLKKYPNYNPKPAKIIPELPVDM